MTKDHATGPRTTRQGGRAVSAPASARAALLAAAVAALPFPAYAVQGTIQVNSGEYVEGHFQAPGTQRWRVYLQKGQLYAVHGNTDEVTKVVVRAASGALLGSFYENWDYENDGGVSVKAPYAGYYTVAVTAPRPCSAGVSFCVPEFPMYYVLAADFDCAGDGSTVCGIAVGQTRKGLKLSFLSDHDWFRTSLRAGKRYTASLFPGAEDGCTGFAVRDASGAVLASVPCQGGTIPITAGYTGTYYLEAGANGDMTAPSTYELSLRAD